jgi:hypothetical protein
LIRMRDILSIRQYSVSPSLAATRQILRPQQQCMWHLRLVAPQLHSGPKHSLVIRSISATDRSSVPHLGLGVHLDVGTSLDQSFDNVHVPILSSKCDGRATTLRVGDQYHFDLPRAAALHMATRQTAGHRGLNREVKSLLNQLSNIPAASPLCSSELLFN